MPPPPTFDARLVAARALTPNVRELTFERVDGAPMQFDAGQWVSLVLPGLGEQGTELRRSYSIASAPGASPRFDVAITRVETGAGSKYLHALPLGATLRTIGPQGFFTRTKETGPALFVATGTGVTPFRSMLRAAASDATPTWLLFGVRHEEDALYRDELDAIARDRANVKLFVTLSKPRDEWTGRRGWVQHHVKELYDSLAKESAGAQPHVYICGLERMVGSVREILRGEMRLARQQVHSERYD